MGKHTLHCLSHLGDTSVPTKESARQSTERAVDEPLVAAIDVLTDLIVKHTHVATQMSTLNDSIRTLPALMLVHAPGTENSSTCVDAFEIDVGVEAIGTF